VVTPLDVVVSDAQNDPVSCSFTGLPAGLAETSECRISGTIRAAAGTYTVTIAASDGQLSATPVSFTWTVTATPASNPETPPAPAAMPSMAVSASSSRVGATVGQFRVAEDGSANYSIPVRVAQGSGGFSPPVSLDYSSGAGIGPAGLGWSIGGQSVISRCAQTLEQDGASAVRGISMTATDRFCLDGQRLMLVAGTYGAAGSEYRTEIESFAKVIANGVAGTGPASFTVWRKDGTVTEYGHTADSRIEARATDTQTVLLWAQNRVTDAAGNYILYGYQELAGSIGDAIEFTLQKISFTGNQRAGTSPFAEVNFIYEDLPGGGSISYLAGTKLVQGKRLTRIDSQSRLAAGSALQFLRSYVLSYTADPFGRSILASVKECRDSSQAYCFQPTVFDWLLRDDAINTATTGSFSFPSVLYGLVLADTNGDGRPDLVYTEKSGSQFQLKTALAQASGGFSITSTTSTLPKDANNEPVKVTAIDLNADGRQDLIYAHDAGTGPKWYVQYSGGSSGFSVLANAAGVTLSLLRVMDLDGDGLPDLLYGYKPGSGPGRQLVWQRNLFTAGGIAGLAAPQPITVQLANLFPDSLPSIDPNNPWYINDEHPSFAAESNPIRSQVFDFNGDGAVDLLVKVSRQYCSGQCGFEKVNSSSGAFLDLQDLSEERSAAAAAAVNPPDQVTSGSVATAAFWVVYQSNGLNDFGPPRVVARDTSCNLSEVCNAYSAYPVVTDPQPADINLDGLADLLYRTPGGGWEFRLNTAGTFSATTAISGHLTAGVHYAAQLQDFNGDGWPDLAYPSVADSSTA
ncbi:MAG TPA: FG-GAP-like repeat-containing protein, partial [Xanthomonadales bacterium]|nr:FG-GAP-like repeat-containing protein [Xanthomonadales bacterium]